MNLRASAPSDSLREVSDEMLASRIAARDVDAFALIYDRYIRPVYAIAGHMLGAHEAEEAAQEIFMRLWNKATQFDAARGPFSHWFLSIARNHLLDKLRARSERLRVVAAEEIDLLLAEAADPRVDVLDQVWQKQRGDALLHALQRIPAEQRRVIVLAYFGGMSQSEISMHLNVPLGTVKNASVSVSKKCALRFRPTPCSTSIGASRRRSPKWSLNELS
jgi:RNA polymerase sigma-70 factor (ECF subfamily)